MISDTRYVIAVPDLEASVAYYRDVLGFEARELAPGWKFLVRGGSKIMAGECADAAHPSSLGDHNYFAYMLEDDIDAYYESLRGAGATFTKRLRDEPWGMREFGVRTVDGHRIMFAQRIATS